MINLNKEVVTKELLLDKIQDVDIYRFYSGRDVVLSGGQHSPLRKDKNPSFGYYAKGNEILFNDFVVGGGDCIKFVMLLFGLTYFEALSKIVVDFNLTTHFIYKKSNKTNKNYTLTSKDFKKNLLNQHNKFNLKKKSRDWRLYDYTFWYNFGITSKILEKYNVEPISHIFIGDSIITADKYAYCFKEFKDGVETYKIYQPFNKDYKWLNNHNDSVWQGWEQLPEKDDFLIITKSLKDVMSIVSVLGFPAVSLQSESVIPKESVIKELKSRFKYIDIFYDNDFDQEENWGQIMGNKLRDLTGFSTISIPDVYKSKDFSDLVKNKGIDKAKDIYHESIAFPF